MGFQRERRTIGERRLGKQLQDSHVRTLPPSVVIGQHDVPEFPPVIPRPERARLINRAVLPVVPVYDQVGRPIDKQVILVLRGPSDLFER